MNWLKTKTFLMIIIFIIYLLKFIATSSSTIQTIKVRENVNVTLTCRLYSGLRQEQQRKIPLKTLISSSSSSEGIILWYKDDTTVIGVNSISNDPANYIIQQLDFETYELTVLHVQLEDTGEYKCQNFTAKEENRFQLTVIVPPSRLRLNASPHLPVHEETAVSFNCTTERTYPNPTFEWYINDKLIQKYSGNQTSQFSSYSIISLKLNHDDNSNILRCQVSNEASTKETNIELKLEVFFKPIVNIFWKTKQVQRTLTVIENTYDIIQCSIIANPSQNSIEWLRNDQLINGQNQDQLYSNFTQSDEGKLTCRVRNTAGISEASVNVIVLYKPKLSLTPKIILNQGERLNLKCSINANPSCHSIRWFHFDQELISLPCSTNQNFSEYTIPSAYRLHSGKYTCEVKNWLNTGIDRKEAISNVTSDVWIQYAPFILNREKKFAVFEGREIVCECIVDAFPKSEISWYAPSGQRLSSFTEEKSLNATVVVSQLHLPPSYSSMLGLYRCQAKNEFGQHDYSIQFQRPGIPDPPSALQIINLTHSSFTVGWTPGYAGGSSQTFYVLLNGNQTEEKRTSSTHLRFTDLNEKMRYFVKIRSKNTYGFSDYSTSVIAHTTECPVRPDDFPSIQQAFYTVDRSRIRFKLGQNTLSIQNRQLCIKIFNARSNISPSIDDVSRDDNTSSSVDENIPCILIDNNVQSDGIPLTIQYVDLKIKLCLYNQTDVCSSPVQIPTGVPLSGDSSELILILTGVIAGLCAIALLIIITVCYRRHKRKQSSSTDKLKPNKQSYPSSTFESFHATPVRVVDGSNTNTCLYYPQATINEPKRNGNNTFYNQSQIEDFKGVYSIQDKNSTCFDSGMPSTSNSDSAVSHSISELDGGLYDRTEIEQLVTLRKKILPDAQQFLNKLNMSLDATAAPTVQQQAVYTTGRAQINSNLISRISSEEESGYSTPTKGKKLVYEVVV